MSARCIVPARGRRVAAAQDRGEPAATDDAYIPTLAALAGTVVGGLTSFATTWLT